MRSATEPPRAFLFDLDGTLYAGGAAIPGAADTLRRLRAAGVPFRLVTNTTGRSRSLLVKRMEGYGLDVGAEEIFTAISAAVEVAQACGYARIAPFIPRAAFEDLAPLELAGGTSGQATDRVPHAVMVGDLGDEWSFALMQEAFEHLMNGADLIAVERDRYWLKDGRLTLDAGAFVAGLEFASGKVARIAGKPSRDFFGAALRSLGALQPASVAMVGDDLWSDVEGAQLAGLQGWLVRTGKFRDATLQASGIRPDRVLDSVAALE